MPEKRLTLNPRAYSTEDLALIERALKLMLAGRSADQEPEVIPPGDPVATAQAILSLSLVVHARRKRVLQEEPNHLAGGIGSARKGVGSGGAAARPGVAGPMNDPLFRHRLAAGISIQYAAVAKTHPQPGLVRPAS